MKRLLFCCLLLLAGLVAAQEAEPTPEATVVTEDIPAHDQIAVLQQHMEDALNANDIDSLLYGLTKEVVFSTMNGEVVRGRENIQAQLARLTTGPDASLKELTIDLHVQDSAVIYNEDDLSEVPRCGIAYGRSVLGYTLADGRTFQVRPDWSATLIREQDSWKVAAFHIGLDIVDDPTLEKARQKTFLVGALCLVIGLLCGYLAGKVRRKNLQELPHS